MGVRKALHALYSCWRLRFTVTKVLCLHFPIHYSLSSFVYCCLYHHYHFSFRNWLGDPSIYVLDCSGAGALIEHFLLHRSNSTEDSSATRGGGVGMKPGIDTTGENRGSNSGSSPSSRERGVSGRVGSSDEQCFLLAACRKGEVLPFNPQYPADIFTSCLTTPIFIAVRWFILQNPLSMVDINPDLSENIPGDVGERKTPRGELNWIFTAITDTIAWDTLPSSDFQKLFRQDLLVASMFRNFLFAKRMMRSFNCEPQSYPSLPDTSSHRLWKSWDLAVESFLTNYQRAQKAPPLTSFFFCDHLSSFEIWLDFGGRNDEAPLHLPILLQVLLSQNHRLRALKLLERYLSTGNLAVNRSLIVGIFPYIMKLLQSPAGEVRKVLISIWASILGFDPSCRQELIRDKSHGYFMQYLVARDTPNPERCKAIYALAEICNGFKEGQQTCLQQGLHRSCSMLLGQKEYPLSNNLKKWVALCIFKLCENNVWAKFLFLSEKCYTQLFPLLINEDPCVRAASCLALGEVFGGGDLRTQSTAPPSPGSTKGVGPVQDLNCTGLHQAELLVALQILEGCTDGSPLVRRECVIAISKFISFSTHLTIIKAIAKFLMLQHTKFDGDKESGGVEYEVGATQMAELTAIIGELLNNVHQDFLGENTSAAEKQHGTGGTMDESNQNQTVAVARTYIRIWLAFLEMERKEPHPLVLGPVRIITKCIREILLKETGTTSTSSTGAFSDSNRGFCGDNENGRASSVSSPQPEQFTPKTTPISSHIHNPPGKIHSDITYRVGVDSDGTKDVASRVLDFSSNIVLRSFFYDWNRVTFLGRGQGYNAFDDPQSREGSMKILKEIREKDFAKIKQTLQLAYKDYDERPDDIDSLNGATGDMDGPDSMRSSRVSKFEQSIIIHPEHSMSITAMLFHPYSDILAISDGPSVGLWSINDGCKMIDISCSSQRLGAGLDRVQKDALTRPAVLDTSVTSIGWINETSDSLLAVGSDDGSLRVWRDLGERAGSLGGGQISLASAFLALPDVAHSKRGSGLIMSWQQRSGILSVAGNSSTIRLWDLGREQCVRLFHTGSSTCISSLSSSPNTPSLRSNAFSHPVTNEDIDYQTWTWLLAGFGDGTLGVFDERISSNGGKVSTIKAHNSWVVSTHLRSDDPVAITSCVTGGIKFWDIRVMRSFHHIDAERTKSPITSLSIHSCAPLLALGSHAQFINIMTFNGRQIGKIRYFGVSFNVRRKMIFC